MVYAFIIHTLLPGQCKVLFHQTYGADASEIVDERTPTGIRAERKANIEFVASQVHSEYQFRRSVSNRSIEEEMQAVNQDDQLPEFELGFFRLAKDKPFRTEKCVVWLGAGNSGFTLICHKEENRVLAENVLKLLIRYLQEYLRVLNQPAEAALKADRVCLVTQKFLPDGSLTFMNHRVIRSLERELEILIKT